MSHDMFKQISDIGYVHGLKVCSTHMLEIHVSHLDVSLDAPICAPAVLHQPVVFDCSCLYAPVPVKKKNVRER